MRNISFEEDGVWYVHGKGRSTPGHGAWGKDLELAPSGESQIFLTCSGFLTTLHVTLLKGDNFWEQSQDLPTALCFTVGIYLLGSTPGEKQLQNMSSHAVYLLKASFSDSLMN